MNIGLLIFLLAAISGLCLLIAGVHLLLGLGWALIAGAGSMFCIAGFLRKGLISG